jgi:stage V sporulation protein R
MDQRRNWDKKLGQGLNKICEAMMTHNDLTFLYNYLTPEFCVENGFHVTQRDDEGNVYMTSSEFEQVRQQLIGSLANLGQPKLQVVNSDHERRGELVIRHEFDERTLDLDLAEPTCVNLYKIWGRRVTVLTRDEDGQPLVISYDGKIFEQDTADPDYLSYFEDGE